MRNKLYINPEVRIHLYALMCVVITLLVHPVNVYAANARLTFGSEEYTQSSGSEFRIGAYIRADAPIGDYNVQIKYDSLRLEFVEGAENVDTENGIITLSGNAETSKLKFWLKFRAISGGEASVEFTEGTVSDYEIVTYAAAPIHLSGEDTAAQIEAERAAEAEEAQVLENAQNATTESSQESEEIETEEEEEQQDADVPIVFNIFFVAMILVLGLCVVSVSVVWTFTKRSRKKGEAKKKQNTKAGSKPQKKKVQKAKREETDLQVVDLSVEEPVIEVCDVTMEFKLSSVNPSGLKEYLIQLIKREVRYRRLFALYHVSFNVYQGEIVGIIGTNGSGKSTLLKIVSGALKPTCGHVEVDRRKIQLLTLGTGFDMELTGRENVFLNGSIIGYSREFLEAHYDEIVAFAELEDFMEQKVKNYSSGMVSRLGFAIATAGDAAEILILDEVLSVGDEFFRKKSLKRVKEMIHGGSTVLMVSHGMGTIIDNCTKCVWIEKGELRMIGEPEKVCAEYRKMNEE